MHIIRFEHDDGAGWCCPRYFFVRIFWFTFGIDNVARIESLHFLEKHTDIQSIDNILPFKLDMFEKKSYVHVSKKHTAI